MNILIVGCGLVGSRLADILSRAGHDLAIVDRNADRFKNLSEDYEGLAIDGMPMDISVLENAGIADCDALAAVTEDDNMNIVIAQIARDKYKVANIVTAIEDPSRETVFETFGLNTICPTKITVASVANVLLNEPCRQSVQFINHRVGFTARGDKHYSGKRLNQIPVFPGEIVYGIIDANGNIELATNPDRVVSETDRVVFSSLID